MSLPASQQRILDRIEHSLHVSDPPLRSMFAIFTKLVREEGMPLPEELAKPLPRMSRFELLARHRRQRPTTGAPVRGAPGSGLRAVILILIALLWLTPAAFLGRGLSARRSSGDSASEHRTWTSPGQNLPASALRVCISSRNAEARPDPHQRRERGHSALLGQGTVQPAPYLPERAAEQILASVGIDHRRSLAARLVHIPVVAGPLMVSEVRCLSIPADSCTREDFHAEGWPKAHRHG